MSTLQCPGVSLGQALVTTALFTALPRLPLAVVLGTGRSPQPGILPTCPKATQRQYAIVNMPEGALYAPRVTKSTHTYG